MKFDFSEEKNAWLKENRGINFDDVIEAIKNNKRLDTINNLSKKHTNQRVFVVEIDEYAYAVPFVVDTRGVFILKTVYPDRKLTKKYLNK